MYIGLSAEGFPYSLSPEEALGSTTDEADIGVSSGSFFYNKEEDKPVNPGFQRL